MDAARITEELEALANRAWEDHFAARAQFPNVVPATCAPVLFFGDLAAYRASPLKIVTVGLNPSDREFPQANPWQRFPGGQQGENYLEALSRYFEVLPLNWFACFRQLLHGLDASFYTGAANRAVHTDLCSVVPTAPTWSALPQPVQQSLAARGIETWHRVITELRPHVIITSVRYSWLDGIAFESLTSWAPVHTVERTNPYVVEGRRMRLPGAGTTLLIRGRAANTPFGLISNRDRYAVGRSIQTALRR
jgi:hypothetical protein